MSDSMLQGMAWQNFLVNDNIRGLDPGMQAQVKSAWLRSVAPKLYPDFNTNVQARADISNYVYNSQFAPIRPWESEIVTPESLNLTTGIGHIEASQTYRRLNFAQQQEMKTLWYQKMSQADPEWQTLDRGQQDAFFQRLMERPPGYDGRISNIASNSHGIFNPVPIELLNDPGPDWNEEIQVFGKMVTNFVGTAITEIGAFALAPLRHLAPENPISQFFLDARKERQWQNWQSDKANFLTESVPSFAGTMTGILVGPYLGVEKVFAKGGGALLGKITQRVPQIVGEASGAGVAGMVQGIASAVTEGSPWNANLLGDATLGVGLEFITRYAGAFRHLQKMANELDVDVKHLLRPEYDTARSVNVTSELERVVQALPGMGQFVSEAKLVDPHGLLLNVLETRRGVDMLGDVLDLDVRHAADAIEVWKGNDMLRKFTGEEGAQVRDASRWMFTDDVLWEPWERSLKGKSIMEIISTSPDIEMRVGRVVPDEARAHVEDFFTTHGLAGYFSDAAGIRETVLSMDDVYSVLRRTRKPKGIPEALASRGILFDGSMDAHRAATEQLRAEILHRFPEKPFFIINASKADNPRIVNIKDMPTALIEDSRIYQPMMNEATFTGNGERIRNVLSNLKKKYADIKRSQTVMAKNSDGTVVRYLDNQVVEMRTRVPDGTGRTFEALISFPSIGAAQTALNKGFTKGMKKVMLDGLFNGLNKGTKKSYDQFLKNFRKHGDEALRSSFMPYAYAVDMGRQNGYSVGVVGGRYIVEDGLADTHIYRKFDDLNGVFKFLQSNDARHTLPDMQRNVAQSTMEAVEPEGIRDPMRDLDEADIPESRDLTGKPMGLRSLLTRYGAPTQWAIQKLERTKAAQWLKSKGYSLTEIYNQTQQANRMVHAFINERERTIHRLLKGINKDKGSMIYRYVEALDSEAEFRAKGDLADRFETKETVLREMTETYDAATAQRMQGVAAEVANYFDDMFSRLGIDYGKFLKHYMPHIKAEAAKKSGRLDVRLLDFTSNLNVPEVEGRAFFTMLRETEPGKVLFETDLKKLLETYTHIAGRELFMVPTIKRVSAPIREMISGLKEGATRNDYEQIVKYVADYFDSINGIHSSADTAFRVATEETLTGLTRGADKILGTNFKKNVGKRRVNIVNSMITLSTGAHIAGRLFSAMRNLTQSLVTTGSLLGFDWWLKGVDDLAKPGGLAVIENLGIIQRNAIPVSGWDTMDTDTFVRKAISIGMTPFMGADWINRGISYYAGAAKSRNALQLFREGKLNDKAFARISGARLHGVENFNQAQKILSTAPDANTGAASFEHFLGEQVVGRTQWLYDNFNQPQLFRRGIGKWAGTYTSWPINFMNFVGNITGKSGMPAIERVRVLARLGVATSSIAYGLYSAGLGTNSFMPWNMMTVSAGPHFQMAVDLAQGIGGNRDSFMRFVRGFSNFVPFMYEGESIDRSLQAMRDGEFTEALLHFISAPLRTDVYPRRESQYDKLEKELFNLGSKYIEWMQDPAARMERREEAVSGLFD